jgi:hypothetical protein
VITFDPTIFEINPLHKITITEIGNCKSKLIEVEDFLLYPTEVRDFLISLPRQDAVMPQGRRPMGFFPGYQTYLTYDLFYLNSFMDYLCKNYFESNIRRPSWSFQTVQSDKLSYAQSSYPHSDAGSMAGNLFLNTSDEIEDESGTAFYRFNETGEEAFFPNNFLYRKKKYGFAEPNLELVPFAPIKDNENWSQYYVSKQQWNKLNVYEGALFHSVYIKPNTYVDHSRMTMSFVD